MKTDKFNIEYQYQIYLERVGLKESEMPDTQKKEMRRCFFGAFGQLLVLLEQDATKLPEKEVFEKLDSMINQVSNFFLNETYNQN